MALHISEARELVIIKLIGNYVTRSNARGRKLSLINHSVRRLDTLKKVHGL